MAQEPDYHRSGHQERGGGGNQQRWDWAARRSRNSSEFARFRFLLDLLQRDLQIRGRLKAALGILAQTAYDDPFELARYRANLANRFRLVASDRGEDG